jgi:hypothetical protein
MGRTPATRGHFSRPAGWPIVITASRPKRTVTCPVGSPRPLVEGSHEPPGRSVHTAVHTAVRPCLAGHPGHRDVDLPAVSQGRRVSRLAGRHVALQRVHRCRRNLPRRNWQPRRVRWDRESGVRAAGRSMLPARGSAHAAARLSSTLRPRLRYATAPRVARSRPSCWRRRCCAPSRGRRPAVLGQPAGRAGGHHKTV